MHDASSTNQSINQSPTPFKTCHHIHEGIHRLGYCVKEQAFPSSSSSSSSSSSYYYYYYYYYYLQVCNLEDLKKHAIDPPEMEESQEEHTHDPRTLAEPSPRQEL